MPTPSIEIAGHSLGAALATYYAAENTLVHKISNPALCTFASPKVGDQTFVGVFNGLGLTSWRVVNKQDIVPLLPPLFSQHVDTERLYDFDNLVQPGFGCWHALTTYLHLIDRSLPLDGDCMPQAECGDADLREHPFRMRPNPAFRMNQISTAQPLPNRLETFRCFAPLGSVAQW